MDLTLLSPTAVLPANAVEPDVPRAKLLVPAPIAVLTSEAVIPVFNVGAPLLSYIAALPLLPDTFTWAPFSTVSNDKSDLSCA